jgi:hypothetical protein
MPSEFGALPQTPQNQNRLRFWFAQGIEAVSFFAEGEKDTSG